MLSQPPNTRSTVWQLFLKVIDDKDNEWFICQVKKATDSGVCGKRLPGKPKTIIAGRVCCGWSKNIIIVHIITGI